MGNNEHSTILIVDDIPENIHVLKSLLTQENFVIKGVTDGESALQAAKVLIPDVILLDIMMPGMDGFEVCAKLKADPELKDIPVIFITALADMDSKVKAFEIGGSDYITKPFQSLEVFSRVKSQLQVSRYSKMLKSHNISLMEKINKMDEEKLKAMALLDTAFEQSNIGMGFINIEEKILSINKYFVQLLGYEDQNTLIGQNPFDFAVEDNPDKKKELFKKLHEENIPSFSIEQRYYKKDRSIIWLNIFISKISHPTTDEISYIMIAKDITERKNTQRLLEERQIEIESLINITMEAILVFENDVCVDVNDEAISLFKSKEKQDILGCSIFDLIEPVYHESIKELIDPKYTLAKEISMLKKDGSSFIALVRSIEIRINQNVKTVFTVVDLSKSKKKDQMLYQQSKMAAMGEMIGNIAHQWRQPLSIISTAATGMLMQKQIDTLSDENFQENCNLINENAQFLSKTIDDFRDFFKQDKIKTTFDLSKTLKKVEQLIYASLKNNNIILISKLEENITITSFENEFIQAILNILNNAKDALKSLEHIENKFIKLETYIDQENTIKIVITDNGGGIKESVKNSIFDPYVSTKHKSQGTGIGLYMTYQIIVEHMDGTIKANNVTTKEENQNYVGAQFVITLPINNTAN